MKMIDQLPFATNQDRTEEAAKYWSFVSGADLYNQILTGGVSMTLASARMDPHHLPCAILEEHETDIRIPIDVPTGEHKSIFRKGNHDV